MAKSTVKKEGQLIKGGGDERTFQNKTSTFTSSTQNKSSKVSEVAESSLKTGVPSFLGRYASGQSRQTVNEV